MSNVLIVDYLIAISRRLALRGLAKGEALRDRDYSNQ